MKRSYIIPDPETVSSRQEFVDFASAMLKDLHENQNDWGNPTLERFLEALTAYSQAVPGCVKNTGSTIDPDKPSWQLFALLLAGARVYE